MSRLFKTMLAIVFMGMLLTTSFAQDTSNRPARKLMQRSFDGNSRAANNVRSQAATSAAILEAVRNGGNPAFTQRAGRVGTLLVQANAQNDDEVFRLAESLADEIPPTRGGK